MSLIAICVGVMGFWRLSQDLELASNFVFEDGLLSHWQVWLATATAIQYGAWSLKKYGRGPARVEIEEHVPADAQSPTSDEISANNPASLRP